MKKQTQLVLTTLLITFFGGSMAVAGQLREGAEPNGVLAAEESAKDALPLEEPSLEIPSLDDSVLNDVLPTDVLPTDVLPTDVLPTDVLPTDDLPKASDLEPVMDSDDSVTAEDPMDAAESDAEDAMDAEEPVDAEDPMEAEESDLGEADLGESGTESDIESATGEEEQAPEQGDAVEDDAAAAPDSADDQAIDAATMKLQQAAQVSLSDALEQVGEVSEDVEQARSITFFGDVEKPLIGIEIGTRAIAINALDGAIVGTQEITDLPNPDQRAALEAAAMLKTFATASLQEAIAAAETYAGEAPHRVILEVDDGNLIYKASVAEEDVFVDAGDAKVLYTASQQTVPATAEKPRSTIQISDLLDNPIP